MPVRDDRNLLNVGLRSLLRGAGRLQLTLRGRDGAVLLRLPLLAALLLLLLLLWRLPLLLLLAGLAVVVMKLPLALERRAPEREGGRPG